MIDFKNHYAPDFFDFAVPFDLHPVNLHDALVH